MFSQFFLSNDVDIFADEDLQTIVSHHSLDDNQVQDPRIHLCSGSSFQTGPNWQDRALVVNRKGHRVRLPHPHDILVSKLPRLEQRDLLAYTVVIENTGHPSEAELIEELQNAVDLYRPSFDEEKGSAIWQNTMDLWKVLFKREIDVRGTIVSPALDRRRGDYDMARGGSKNFLTSRAAKEDVTGHFKASQSESNQNQPL